MSRARRATGVARTSAAAVLGVLVTLLVASVVLAPSADAASYRYWTYWSGERPGSSATWTFSSRGPATDVAKDGTVLGWRFAVTTRAGDSSSKPRQSSALATVCPSLASPVAGRTRVALVVDYGTESAAPPGQHPPLTGSVRVECLSLATTGRVTGADVLREAGVEPRVEDGLVCALDGYPSGECAPVVSSPSRPSASPTRTPTRTASPRPSASTPTRTATPARTSSAAQPTPTATATATAAVSPAPGSVSPSASTGAGASSSPTDVGTDPEALPAVSGAPASSTSSSGNALGFVGGALLVGAVAGAAWWTSRRRGGAG